MQALQSSNPDFGHGGGWDMANANPQRGGVMGRLGPKGRRNEEEDWTMDESYESMSKRPRGMFRF